MTRPTAMSLRDIEVSYHGAPEGAVAVRGVSLEIPAGAIVGLAGESGCGKSTLALCSTGYRSREMARVSGASVLDGVDLLSASQKVLRATWGKSIAFVPQDASRSLSPSVKIGKQFAEVLRLHLGQSDAAATHRRDSLLERVGLPTGSNVADRYLFEFSGGQQQRLAIAMAIACEPSVLILDEPTTGLDVTTQLMVSELIQELVHESGAAALYVSHDLGLLKTLCDSINVMYAGEILESGPAEEVWTDPRHPYSAALLDAVPPLTSDVRIRTIPGQAPTSAGHVGCSFAPRCSYVEPLCHTEHPLLTPAGGGLSRCLRHAELGPLRQVPEAINRPQGGKADQVLSLSAVSCFHGQGDRRREVVTGATLTVARGEVLAVVGESGSGKSTLLRAIIGLHSQWTGDITFDGARLDPSAARRSREQRRAMQIVFQNPASSLNPSHTVGRIIERSLSAYRPELDRRARERRVNEVLEQVHLPPDAERRHPQDLSGGQQQRVAIARALAVDPVLMLCDEIVSALDVSVQAAILDLILELKRSSNCAFVFVSHDLGVVRSVADTIVVMQAGTIVEAAPTALLYSAPRARYTRELLDAAVSLSGENGTSGSSFLSEGSP